MKILNSSSISESPGSKGRFVAISAKIQPTDQISTGVEYYGVLMSALFKYGNVEVRGGDHYLPVCNPKEFQELCTIKLQSVQQIRMVRLESVRREQGETTYCVSVGSNWNVDGSGQTKVGELKTSSAVNKKVLKGKWFSNERRCCDLSDVVYLRLEISVKNAVSMAEGNSFQKLETIALDELWMEVAAVA